MRYRLNPFVNYCLVLCTALLCAHCVQDDFIETDKVSTNGKTIPNLHANIFKGDSILKTNALLKQKIDKYIRKKPTVGKMVHSNHYQFHIDTTKIQQIETESYISYTFVVQRDSVISNMLENYVYTIYNNENESQYLISYPFDEDLNVFPLAEAEITQIYDDALKTNGCASLVEYEELVCVDTRCKSGEHVFSQGEACIFWGTSDMATRTCTGGAWVDQGCEDGNNGGTHYDGSGTTGNGGNANDNSPTNPNEPDEDLVVVPFVLNELDPCPQMQEIGQNAQLRQIFTTLKQAAETTTFRKEVGYLLKKQTNGSYTGTFVEGQENEPGISVRLEQGAQIDIFAHTHYEGLSSMLTSGDLKMYADFINAGVSQNGSEMVFIAITQKGTRYAIRITNLTKFNIFVQRNLATSEKFELFREEHFEGKIYDNNTVEANELAFMEMMRDTDCGMTLFEANEDFTEWKQLALSDGNVVRQTCN